MKDNHRGNITINELDIITYVAHPQIFNPHMDPLNHICKLLGITTL